MGRTEDLLVLFNDTQKSKVRQELASTISDEFEAGWYLYEQDGKAHFDELTKLEAQNLYKEEMVNGLHPLSTQEGENLKALHELDVEKLWASIEDIEKIIKKEQKAATKLLRDQDKIHTSDNTAKLHNLTEASLTGVKVGGQAQLGREDTLKLVGGRLTAQQKEEVAILLRGQATLVGVMVQAGMNASISTTIKTRAFSLKGEVYAHANAIASAGWTGLRAEALAETGVRGTIATGAPSLFGKFRIKAFVSAKVYARAHAKATASFGPTTDGIEVSVGAGAFAGVGVDVSVGFDIIENEKNEQGKHFKIGTGSVTAGSGYGVGVGVLFTPFNMASTVENGKKYTSVTFAVEVQVPTSFGTIPIKISIGALVSDDYIDKGIDLSKEFFKKLVQHIVDTEVVQLIAGPIKELQKELEKASIRLKASWNDNQSQIVKMTASIQKGLGLNKKAFETELVRHQEKDTRYLKDTVKYIEVLKKRDYSTLEIDTLIDKMKDPTLKEQLKGMKDKDTLFYIQKLQQATEKYERRIKKQDEFLNKYYQEAIDAMENMIGDFMKDVQAMHVKDLNPKDKSKSQAKLIEKLVAIEKMIDRLDDLLTRKKQLLEASEVDHITQDMEKQLIKLRNDFSAIYLILEKYVKNVQLN